MTQSGEDRVRQANAAFGSGDLGALQSQFLAEDVVWHVPGRGPLAGDYQGIAEVIALFGKISELSGGTARFTLHDVLANPKFPPADWVDAFDQVVEPLITEIT